MTKTVKSILRNLSNTIEWCVEPQLLSRATVDRQREQAALDRALKELEYLIRTEKLKLLAEVRERVVGEYETEYSNLDGDAGYWEKHGRNGMREKQIEALTKLEAEL